MPAPSHKILLAEDDQRLSRQLGKLLRANGWEVDEVSDGASALQRFRDERYAIVLLDLNLPDMSGVEVLEQVRTYPGAPPVVLMSGYLDVESTLAALRAGAAEILEKPVPYKRLMEMLLGLVDTPKERQTRAVPELVGRSRTIRSLVDQVLSVASYELPVMILGETGTGKELVAHAIHRHSKRDGTIVSINCAALPDSLVESELFGHASGSFTGAGSARKGLFELAGVGTVFLDEVGELSASHQAKLLRVLETRVFRPVGSNTWLPLRARVMSATNRNLGQDSTFRADLFYRLAGAVVRTPRLCDHIEDLELIANHLLALFAQTHPDVPRSISPAALEACRAYHWPGNVRELKAVLQSAAIRVTTPELGMRSIVESMRDRGCFPDTPSPADRSEVRRSTVQRVLDVPAAEREMILQAYDECDHNLSHTARRVKLPRSTLRDRLKRYGVL